MTARIEHLVTRGTVSSDGRSAEVENNVWLLGDDEEVLVFDAPHDPDAIGATIGDRTVVAIVCTHGDDDHVRYAEELAEQLSTQVLLHPEDRPAWDRTHARHEPDGALREGQVLTVAGTKVHVLHTPGHSPGGVCFSVPALGVLVSGDTLRAAAPDTTAVDDEAALQSSLRRLLDLPPDTRVLPGHGPETTIAAAAAAHEGWLTQLPA